MAAHVILTRHARLVQSLGRIVLNANGKNEMSDTLMILWFKLNVQRVIINHGNQGRLTHLK